MTSTGFLAGAAIALMLALPAGAQVVASSSGGAAGSLVGQSSANAASPDRAANRPAEEAGSQSATTSTAGVVASASTPYIPALLNSGASRRNDQPPATLGIDVGADDEVLAGAPKSTVQNFAGPNYAGAVSNAAANEPVIVSP